MAEHKYSFKNYDPGTMARAVGRSLPVSTKHCIEICNYIRGRKVSVAKGLLSDAVALKKPIPFKRFNADVGHKKGGFSAARYAVKAAGEVLKLINSCEANAQNKALNTNDMVVTHINAHRGSQQFRMGRQRRRRMKRTHVELVLEEVSKKQEKKVPKAEKKDTKTDEKSAAPTKETKQETKASKDEAKTQDKELQNEKEVKKEKEEVVEKKEEKEKKQEPSKTASKNKASKKDKVQEKKAEQSKSKVNSKSDKAETNEAEGKK
ncbi:MAG: 50S ribosomal protein L22 [Nanoarchaeota archaeon]